MIIIKFIRKVFKVLNSDTAPHEVALGFALGVCLGLAPITALYGALLILVFLVLRCNLTAVLLGLAIFKGLGLLFVDRLSAGLGAALLSTGPVESFVAWASYAPILSLAELNNTLVLGGIVLGWVVAAPAAVAVYIAVVRYRNAVSKHRQTTITKLFKKVWILKVLRWALVGPDTP